MVSVKKRRFRYSLRTVLVATTLIAVGCALWARSQKMRSLAAECHMRAMDAGYHAASIQRPVDFLWEWKQPSPMRMDRATIVEAARLWRESIEQSNRRDSFLAAARSPWLPVQHVDSAPTLEVPEGDLEAQQWWMANFADYINDNVYLLDAYGGFTSDQKEKLDLTLELLTPEQLAWVQSRFWERRKSQPVVVDRINMMYMMACYPVDHVNPIQLVGSKL